MNDHHRQRIQMAVGAELLDPFFLNGTAVSLSPIIASHTHESTQSRRPQPGETHAFGDVIMPQMRVHGHVSAEAVLKDFPLRPQILH